MLIRTLIVLVCLSLSCASVFGHQSWTGIPGPDKFNMTPCSRRSRRPVQSSIASKRTENRYSDSSKYSSQNSPPQSGFRLLIPKNLDQPLDLYLESLAIKSEVIEGKLFLFQ